MIPHTDDVSPTDWPSRHGVSVLFRYKKAPKPLETLQFRFVYIVKQNQLYQTLSRYFLFPLIFFVLYKYLFGWQENLDQNDWSIGSRTFISEIEVRFVDLLDLEGLKYARSHQICTEIVPYRTLHNRSVLKFSEGC